MQERIIEGAGNPDPEPPPSNEDAHHPGGGCKLFCVSGLSYDADVSGAHEIVKGGRRALTLKYHPDHGGNAERMPLTNATADYLEKRLPLLLGRQA